MKDRLMGYFFKLLPVLLFATKVMADGSLCGDQTTVFSCSLGKKQVSLCHPNNDEKSLLYRFGTLKDIEFQYPKPPEKGVFYRQGFMVSGGEREYVYFNSEEYTYGIYTEVSRSSNETPHFEDGLKLMKDGKIVKRWVCKDGGDGFKDNISWIEEKNVFDE